MLLSGKVARAFDLDKEDPKVRDRYGRHMFGQSLLLARRLVEAGVPIVQANMGRVQNWDTHCGNFRRLKDELLPPLDRGVSAPARRPRAARAARRDAGGRSPASSAGRRGSARARATSTSKDGRDHWAARLLQRSSPARGSGAARSIGQSDRIGAYPGEPPLHARPTSPRRSTAPWASTRTPSCPIASTARSASAPARRSPPSTRARRSESVYEKLLRRVCRVLEDAPRPRRPKMVRLRGLDTPSVCQRVPKPSAIPHR